MLVKIEGGTHHLWRAVDHEGQVLQAVVTKKRDMKAALKRLRKLLRRCGEPNTILPTSLNPIRQLYVNLEYQATKPMPLDQQSN